MNAPDDALVPNAMRLAEYAHRQRNHHRKAPPGEDRPAYFLHLAEVAWLLLDSGIRDPEPVAAAYLHDIIEDCGYDETALAEAIGNARVAALVAAVSETAKNQSWEIRQQHYRERLAALNDPVILALSCADKTSNLTDMNRLMAKGHPVNSFTKRGFEAQRAKFEALDALFQGRTPERLHQRFQRALAEFREWGQTQGHP
ncbi:MAG: HD domain-containing protein [Candidatus Contendobacter sp.]|nr:HD domain-containing protein [Candidatus Contendobacter sp.]MDG4556982.1 HD domain-containing protein [Candidatus Contendobacter sp.]